MRIESYLRRILPEYPVEVRFTRNRCTMISCRRNGRGGVLRLHQIFEDAPQPVAKAVAELFFLNPRRPQRRDYHSRINEFINRHEQVIARTSRPPRRFEALPGPKGRFHNLAEIFDRLNRRFFGGALDLQITWSDRVFRRTMGTWKATVPGMPNLITINRLLDDSRVPRYYLDVLVYHEMLHEVVPGIVSSGKKIRHTPIFKRRERQHEAFERAEGWGHEHLERMYWTYRQRLRRSRRR